MAQLMTIKTAAAESDLTPQTLREYEKAGLLSPQRTSTGARLYTAFDVQQAKRIAADRQEDRARKMRLRTRRPEAAA